jgi:glycosyltransferase involved in cell wall biosynthesis
MKKIVIVTTSYPARHDGSEAAGSFVKDFAEQLARSCEVKVLGPGTEAVAVPELDCGVQIYRYFGGDRPLSLLSPWNPLHWLSIVRILRSGLGSLRAILRDHHIDHIFALWVLPSGYWAMQAGRQAGVPYSTWALGSDIWSLGRLPIVRGLLRTVLNNSHRNYADGYQLQQDVIALSGADCRFLPSTRVLGSATETAVEKESGTGLRLAFLGRWHPNKGVDILLDALDSLADDQWARIREVRLFGGGPLEPLVHRKVVALQEAQRPVTLGGYLDKPAAASLYAWSDYLLIPSRIESIPVIFSDAMQSGRPVISTPVGDLGRLLGEYRCGVLADSASVSDFSAALRKGLLVANPVQQFAAGIAAAGQQFSIENAVDNFLEGCHSPESENRQGIDR